MQKERISSSQLFMLIVSFQVGSAIVVGVGGEAKRDAWIAVLLAMFLGVLLFLFYYYLLQRTEDKHFFSCLKKLFGKKIGNIFGFAYIIYFLYISSRVMRDFIELANTVIFPHTPIEVITILFLLVVMYYLYLGIEVISRSVGIFMPYLLLFLFLIVLFLFINESIEINRIRPLFAEGAMPIIKAVFPPLLTFPFGEIVVFTLFLGGEVERKGRLKAGIYGVLVSGVMLSSFTVVRLTVLGVDLSERAAFPLLSAMRTISFANFFERLDALVVFVMMLGIFVKVVIFMYGALRGLQYISGIPYQNFVFPVGSIVAFSSIMIANNYAEHLTEGLEFVPKYMHLPFQIFIPLLLFMGLWIKDKVSKKGVNTT